MSDNHSAAALALRLQAVQAAGAERSVYPDAFERTAFEFVRSNVTTASLAAHAADRIAGVPGVEGFARAAVSAVDLDELWRSRPGRELAGSYLRSIAPGSLFDAVARYAQVIPESLSGRFLIASDAVGDEVAEGQPKPVMKPTLTDERAEPAKCTALCVLTDELVAGTDGAAMRLFAAELRSAVLRAFNSAIIGRLNIGPYLPGTGDAKRDLMDGLAAAGPSAGYAVAVRRDVMNRLAIEAEGRLPLTGGDYVPGVAIIPLDVDPETGLPAMIVVPSSRVAMADLGLSMRASSVATLSMRTDPDSPGEMVSLFQVGGRALLVERQYRFYAAVDAVGVG